MNQEDNSLKSSKDKVRFFIVTNWRKIKASFFLVLLIIFAGVIILSGVFLNKQNLDQNSSAAPTIFTPSPTQPNISPNPRGLVAEFDWDENSLISTWALPYIDGGIVRTYWYELNPQKDIYNWKFLDAEFAKASETNKFIHLEIAPGFYSPDWILNDSKITKAKLKVPNGPLKGKEAYLPLPWDQNYLNAWYGFLRQVAKRYGGKKELGYISATGPNSHNGELSLPRETKDIDTWLSLPEINNNPTVLQNKLEAAWKQTFTEYCNDFNSNHFTLAVIYRSLPIDQAHLNKINLNLNEQQMDDQYKADLAAAGFSQCPQVFGLQTNGLDGRPIDPQDSNTPPEWSLVQNYSGKILTGFQTRAPKNLYKCKKSPDSQTCEVDIIKQTMANGLNMKPNFLEVYETDILKSYLTDIFKTTHQELVPNPTSPPSQVSHVIPNGIYAVVAMDKKNAKYSSSDIDILLGNSTVAGIAFRPLWSDLEPSNNSFDFSKIDDVLTRLSSHGKTLQLIIVPGFYSPSWLLSQLPSCDPRPTTGCGKASFEIPYGPNKGKTADLPLPWSQTYKVAWQNFLTNLANRYGNNNKFVSISIAGPTSVSAEMSMPDDLNKWSKLLKFFYPNDSSYWDSDKAFVEEWQKMIDFYGQTFTDRTVVLTMGSGLPSFKKGDPTAAKLQIIDYFKSAKMGTDIRAVQTSGLKACRNNEYGIADIKQLTGQTKDLPLIKQILGGAQFDSSAANNPDTMGCIGDCNSCKGQNISPNKAVLNVLGIYFDTTPFGLDFASTLGQNPMAYLQVYEDDIFYVNDHSDVQSTFSRASQDILKMTPK